MQPLERYNCKDVLATYIAHENLASELAEYSQESIFYDEIIPLAKVVMQMQNKGILFNVAKAKELDNEIMTEANSIRRVIEHEIGVNPASPQQLSTFLYKFMFLRPVGRVKSATMTDDIMLRKLIIRYKDEDLRVLLMSVLRYRKLAKLASTYLRITPDADGRVRSRWVFLVTGRLGSKEPNLQNLPARGIEELGYDVRECYYAPEGHIFLSADYSQLEARIAAYMYECKGLIKLFESGGDFHDKNARILWSVLPEQKVTKDQRRYAKEFAFAITYGGGWETIMERALKNGLYISPEQTRAHIARLDKEYPEMAAGREDQYQRVKRDKVVYTPLGRQRLLLTTTDIRGVALNTPIQGMAAHIINRAMIRLTKFSFVAQIHDRLDEECPEPLLLEHKAMLKAEMEKPVEIFNRSILFPTEQSTGYTWKEVG